MNIWQMVVVGSVLVSAFTLSSCTFSVPDAPQNSSFDAGGLPTDGTFPTDGQDVGAGGTDAGETATRDSGHDASVLLDTGTPMSRDASLGADGGGPCADGVRNGGETDVDCGGADCPVCADGLGCRGGIDCASGVCEGQVCIAPRCGDGITNGSELCDDGNATDGDGCDSDCTPSSCGNGLVDPGEGSCDCPPGTGNPDNEPTNGCECTILEDSDSTCDGVDDDCDGLVDEEHRAVATTCGIGVCLSAGRALCRDGSLEDDCEPAEPAEADAVCDGLDTDCDGRVDEDYVEQASVCGEGGCAAMGRLQCVDGAIVDTCLPQIEADANCDGVDDDCDGSIDEHFVNPPDRVGPCHLFDDSCDETGQRTVVRAMCVDGQLTAEETTEACVRVTEGEVRQVGQWGPCEYRMVCSEQGQRTREIGVCRGGRLSNEEESAICQRVTDGTLVSLGEWSPCFGWETACDEVGMRRRTRTVCRGGVEAQEDFSENCGRSTLGNNCLLRNGVAGLCMNAECAELTSVIANTTGSANLAARHTITCEVSGDSCTTEGTFNVTGPDSICQVSCPIGSQVSVCCSNGSEPCGGSPAAPNALVAVEDATFDGFDRQDCQGDVIQCTARLTRRNAVVDCQFE